MRTLAAIWIVVAAVVVACGHHANGNKNLDSGPGGGGDGNSSGDAGCGLTSCAAQNAQCGLIGDGCGGTINCGGCPMGESCGGGGTLFQCGSGAGSACTPRTCQQANAQCGVIGDGCGSTVDCGQCTPPLTCGGGGQANQCGGVF